jgi:hypothetical protein
MDNEQCQGIVTGCTGEDVEELRGDINVPPTKLRPREEELK